MAITTTSQAFSALGTVLSINSGTSASPTWVPVAEINSISQSGRQVSTVSITNFQSISEEWCATLPSGGSFALRGSYTSDAGRIQMESAFIARKTTGFTVKLPDSLTETVSGDVFNFQGIIESINYDLTVAGVVSFSASIKLSGVMSVTLGS